MNLLDQDRPFPFTIACSSRCRSPVHLQEVVAQFDVAHAQRYQPSGSSTYCATFATDVALALGVVLPTVWGSNGNVGTPMGGGFNRLQANDLMAWCAGADGRVFGWQEVDVLTAIQRSSSGFPTFVLYLNPAGHGHIAVCLPSSGGQMLIAQAGVTCFEGGTLERGFGSDRGRIPVRYFTHD